MCPNSPLCRYVYPFLVLVVVFGMRIDPAASQGIGTQSRQPHVRAARPFLGYSPLATPRNGTLDGCSVGLLSGSLHAEAHGEREWWKVDVTVGAIDNLTATQGTWKVDGGPVNPNDCDTYESHSTGTFGKPGLEGMPCHWVGETQSFFDAGLGVLVYGANCAGQGGVSPLIFSFRGVPIINGSTLTLDFTAKHDDWTLSGKLTGPIGPPPTPQVTETSVSPTEVPGDSKQDADRTVDFSVVAPEVYGVKAAIRSPSGQTVNVALTEQWDNRGRTGIWDGSYTVPRTTANQQYSVVFYSYNRGNVPSSPSQPQKFRVIGQISLSVKAEADRTDEDGNFLISSKPEMPTITATADAPGVDAGELASTDFTWSLKIHYDPGRLGDRIIDYELPPISQPGPKYVFHFGKIVRGGDLLITVRATIRGKVYVARTRGLRVLGTNPTHAELEEAFNALDALKTPILLRIVRQEGLENQQRQFINGLPMWNTGGDHGVGLMQLTKIGPEERPATDDEIWNWRLNIETGIRVFKYKTDSVSRQAGNTAKRIRKLKLEKVFRNLHRSDHRLRHIHLKVPEFTVGGWDFENVGDPGETHQFELDSIRCYNGAAGRDPTTLLPLHEYTLETEKVSGEATLKVIKIYRKKNKWYGDLKWRRVLADERRELLIKQKVKNQGEVDYVNKVLSQDP